MNVLIIEPTCGGLVPGPGPRQQPGLRLGLGQWIWDTPVSGE